MSSASILYTIYHNDMIPVTCTCINCQEHDGLKPQSPPSERWICMKTIQATADDPTTLYDGEEMVLGIVKHCHIVERVFIEDEHVSIAPHCDLSKLGIPKHLR